MLTVDEENVKRAIESASPSEKITLLKLLSELENRKKRDRAQEHFMDYVEQLWPDFIHGAHHRRMASIFEAVARGEKKRVIINMAPRHTKSKFASFLLPSWILGKFPNKKIMQVSNTAELAEGFGRDVRNLVLSEQYRNIFPDTELRQDSKAAGRWSTNHGGEYYATGVGGALAGRGADVCIIDDPHSEGEALAAQFNPAIYDKVYEWYTTGPRQRLQPGGAIIIVMTRWHMRDLTGQIIDASMSKDGVDQWEVIEFPAILPSGKPLWPEYWKISELEAIRAEIPNLKWQAQYQQQPTSEQAAIIKREWWQMWESETPPPVDYIIMTMDTAFEAKQTADYSAALMLGVWYNPEDNDQPSVIVLNAWRDRLEFPDLKEKTLEMYKEWQPDSFIIEKKASGAPLIAEIRRMGIPVQEYTPTRGAANSPNNKLARLNAVADIFASGRVWAPSSERWSTALIDEVASFPAGKNDDWVDCLSLGLSRYRQGGFIGTALDDAVNDGYEYNYRRKAAYY